VLFAHNFDEKPRELSFAVGLPGETGKLLVNLLTEDHSHADERGKHTLMLEGYGYRWYRVGGLDYLLKRSDIDTDAAGKTSHPA
jgi:maltose alpha-D-glucosyltransferase / alpha-amylase